MKSRTRRVFCIMMTLVTLALTVLPAAAKEKTMQGVFGDDLTWRFTPSDNTLTVEGTGEMPSCLLWEFDFYGTMTPWDIRKISDKIEHVVIAEGVTAIGAAMFQGCTALREAQLPDSLRTIGGCAFEHAPLTEIRIPKNVEAIGNSAFAYCDLRTVTFEGTGVVRIGSFAFGGTPFLENAPFDADGLLIQSGHLLAAKSDLHGVCTIPEGVTDIAAYAFTDFEPEMAVQGVQITKVVFPESLKYIGDCAFDECEKLKEAVFSSQDIRFGTLSFQGTALSEKKIETYSAVDTEEPADAPAPTEYRIGAQNREYAKHSFEKQADNEYNYVDRLQTYIVDPDNPYFKAVDGVLYSKDGAVLLRYPGGKTEDTFTVPQGVKVIGAYAFGRYGNDNQPGLRKVILPEGVTVIRECAFDSCANLEEIVLPSTLKTIDACAFSEVTALKAIELPDGLQEIGECFLTGSQVTHVRIPDSVESFRGGAFCGSMLQTIEGYDRIPYKSTSGMERLSFGGTPYEEALKKESETETTEPETEEAPQPEEPKHRNVFIVRDEAGKPTTLKCIKVGLFQRYKTETLQLYADPDFAQKVHIEWRSDNKRVMVDENGLVTNGLHRRSCANIIVSAVDADGNVLLEKSVRLYFYRFDFQLRHLQEKTCG